MLLACSAGLASTGLSGCRAEDDPIASVRVLQAEGQHDLAIERLREWVEADPESAARQLEYGRALLAAGELTRATWPLRRAVERAAGDEMRAIEAGVLLAQALLATGNASDSIAAASAVLAIDPDEREALMVRSAAFASAKQEEAALEDAEAYVELYPADPEGHLQRISLLLAVGEIEEAREAIERISEATNAEAGGGEAAARLCMLQAVFIWEHGEPERGAERVEACLVSHGGERLAVREAVSAYDRARNPERGTEILRAAVVSAPEDLVLRSALADRLRMLGRAEEAEAVLRAGATGDGRRESWLLLHDHLVIGEDYVAARAAMEQALALDPDPAPRIMLAYADDLILSGALEEAAAIAASLPPPGSHMVSGRVHLAQGRADRALEELEAGIRLWPDNATARWLAGRAAERTGDFSRAIDHYRESVRADPSGSRAVRELIELYSVMGAGRNAIEIAGHALQANPEAAETAVALIRLASRLGHEQALARGLAQLAAMPGQGDALAAERARHAALLGDLEAAASILDRALEGDASARPESLALWVQLELDGNRAAVANARLEELFEDRPRSVELALHLERTRAALGASPDARRKILEPFLAPESGSPEVLRALAEIEWEAGAETRAVALLDRIPSDAESASEAAYRAVEIRRARGADAFEIEQRLASLLEAHPRHAVAARDLAQRLADRDPRSERALELARRSAALGGGSRSIETLAAILVRRGEFESAKDVLEPLIASLPSTGGAEYWLARAQEGLGDRASAHAAYRRALSAEGLDASQRALAREALARLAASAASSRDLSGTP